MMTKNPFTSKVKSFSVSINHPASLRISYHFSTLFIFLLFFTLSIPALAQTVKGKVVDYLSKPIQQVNVFNESTDAHAHTNEQGLFVLENTSAGDTLRFSHISFQSKFVIVEDETDNLLVVLNMQLILLDTLTISPGVDALRIISDIDIQTHPVNSSQDILRKVPGLFIGQHAGGGKAEQIFLRGFDVDHGTDVAISVDGLPVNMVSHAHGQGYADLHFVIPETIDQIDFGKGPYYADQGNFNTAGYVNLMTKRKLDNSSIKMEVGQFNTFRLMGMLNVLKKPRHNAYLATEYITTDGPFESPQNFNRINLFGTYSGQISSTEKIGFQASYFTSKWDASGQIPYRAVNDGSITRFGAIDDTEGGNTSRTNLAFDYYKSINSNSSLESRIYYIKYDFELYSNFTFFLEDPENGDQIKQKESRTIYGFQTEFKNRFNKPSIEGHWTLGIGLRNDQISDNELAHTLNRSQTLEFIQRGDIYETNWNAYAGSVFHIKKWMFNPIVRLDYFNFQYVNGLSTDYETLQEDVAIVSPKLNIFYNASNDLQFYLKTGKGFHSNDTRVVVDRSSDKMVPAAYGADLGFLWKPTSKMVLNMAYWYLFLEQEFVYVGDAGIVEPSGRTSRQGIELSYRYQLLDWLFWNLDVNYTHAVSLDEPSGEDYIPLAPRFTFITGLTAIHPSGFYGSFNVRHLGDRPANEDNSIVALGYTVSDLNLGYNWKAISLGIQIQNLFDIDWDETQFATESRLADEPQPVEEIHFTPGTSFFARFIIQYNF
jgi:outer membrane receptor protein involved in Fe transport